MLLLVPQMFSSLYKVFVSLTCEYILQLYPAMQSPVLTQLHTFYKLCFHILLPFLFALRFFSSVIVFHPYSQFFFPLSLKRFFLIYLFERARAQVGVRGRGRGRSRLPAEQGAWCRARSQDPSQRQTLDHWATQQPPRDPALFPPGHKWPTTFCITTFKIYYSFSFYFLFTKDTAASSLCVLQAFLWKSI